MNILLTKTNRNRLEAGTHTLAAVLRNQGYQLYVPPDQRKRVELGGVEYTARPTPSTACAYATGILHPDTGEPVLWEQLRLQ